MASSSVAFAPQISAAANKYGLDPRLLAAVAAQETGGPGSNSGRDIVGDGGHGHGVFQIDDRWHAFAATPAAMDPAKNADYAAKMLSGLLKQFGGNVHAALSAYNTGSPTATGTTTNWGAQILGYADSVLRHYQQLAGTTRDTQMADLQSTSASVNALSSYAAAQTSSASSASSSEASAAIGNSSFTLPPLAKYNPKDYSTSGINIETMFANDSSSDADS